MRIHSAAILHDLLCLTSCLINLPLLAWASVKFVVLNTLWFDDWALTMANSTVAAAVIALSRLMEARSLSGLCLQGNTRKLGPTCHLGCRPSSLSLISPLVPKSARLSSAQTCDTSSTSQPSLARSSLRLVTSDVLACQ